MAEQRTSSDPAVLAVMAFPALLVLTIYGVLGDELSAVRGGVLLAFATLTLLCGSAFVSALERGDRLGIETHWGGLGGGLGGWSLSASLVYLLGALGFGTMTTAVALGNDAADVAEAGQANDDALDALISSDDD